MPMQRATAIADPDPHLPHRVLRPSLTRKAAMMPTISEASTPSRRAMTKVGINATPFLCSTWSS